MNRCVPDEATVQRLIAEIEACTPRPHQAGLLAVAERVIPECPCRFALTRGGWYRAGGLIRADGERLADSLDNWLTRELEDCDDDLGEFLDRHDGEDLLVTRHTGRTHYFIAQYGSDPSEFLQLEVEELQELVDRKLWDASAPPLDPQELSDPIKPLMAAAQVVGSPYYRFRRLTDIKQVVARLPAPIGEMHGLVRFMQEWRASRAESGNKHFSDHWIIALREHHDRYNNVLQSAAPVSRHARELKSFHWNDTLRGLEAGRQLQAFDRAAGYSGAWYFHLVTSNLTPRNIAFAALQDIESGFSYLGDLDTALLYGWLRKPYSL
jgi:hypothetical protein